MIRLGMLIGNRYEILEKIGTGGMSDVYKAKDQKLNRFVAVKVLKQEFSENKNFVSKFRVEAQAAAGLMHPNIVNVYDVGEEDNIHYIVMELVEGITLKKYIEKKVRLTTKEAISIGIQVAMGIEAAHNNHIIHRDIKPQNIIISREGKVKVTDFGIAKAATSNTITSNAMGSVHYSSPEQARGGFSDEKSDIYSFGITLFEMLTGRVPFSGDTAVSIAIKHIQDDMPSPREYGNDIPVSVESIVLKCTQKNPDRRYQRMSDIISDLKYSLLNPDENFVQMSDVDEVGKTKIAPEARYADKKYQNADANNNMDNVPYDNAEEEPDYAVTRDNSEYSERKKTQNKNKTSANSGNTGKNKYTSAKPGKNGNKNKNNAKDSNKSSGKNKDYNDTSEVKSKADIYYDPNEDSEYDYDPTVDKIRTVIAVIVAVALGCAILYVAGRTVGLFNQYESSVGNQSNVGSSSSKADRAVMPKFVNEPAEDVKKALNKINLGCKLTYVESADIDKNKVVSAELEDGQTVLEGDEILLNTTIVLKVSAGANGVKVPEVIGLTEAEATAKLTKEGFKVLKDDRFSDEFKRGTIIEQSVEGNTLAPIESTITIIISKGSENVEVRIPELLGKTEEEAISILESEGLVVGNVDNVFSSDYKEGIICYQSFSTGTAVSQGTKVDIKVSIGTEIASYGCNLMIQGPADYTGGNAEVILTTADGAQQLWYNQSVTSFPVQINLSGFTSSSAYGIVTITYLKDVEEIVTDSDGNQKTQVNQAIAQTQQNVEFIKE